MMSADTIGLATGVMALTPGQDSRHPGLALPDVFPLLQMMPQWPTKEAGETAGAVRSRPSEMIQEKYSGYLELKDDESLASVECGRCRGPGNDNATPYTVVYRVGLEPATTPRCPVCSYRLHTGWTRISSTVLRVVPTYPLVEQMFAEDRGDGEEVSV
jgi:hypothetical protein